MLLLKLLPPLLTVLRELLEDLLWLLRPNTPAALLLLGVNVLLGVFVVLLPDVRLLPPKEELPVDVLWRAVVRVLLSRLVLVLPLSCPKMLLFQLYLPLLFVALLPVFVRLPDVL